MPSLAASQRTLSIAQLLNPITMTRNLWRYRDLIVQFTRREIAMRYRGSFLGIIWSLITPILMLLIYTFVFGVIFQTRWSQARTNNLSEFAVILFCGLTTFSIFSDCISRSPLLIVQHPNYVKKVVFPLEILSVSLLGSALFQATINFGILLVAHLLLGGTIYWTLILLPLLLLPLIGICLGLVWFLSSLGVYIRDVTHLVGLVTQMLFFLTPIFFAQEQIPEPFATLIGLNPLTPIVIHVRDVVLWGNAPQPTTLLILFMIGGSVMICGYAWFMQTRKGFADVL